MGGGGANEADAGKVWREQQAEEENKEHRRETSENTKKSDFKHVLTGSDFYFSLFVKKLKVFRRFASDQVYFLPD